jgi:hypothetical protein
MNTLEWTHIGAEREQAVVVPPVGVGNYGYALVYDPTRARLVYIRMKAYGDGNGEVWLWDGERWERTKAKSVSVGDECHAFFDAARGGVALWGCDHDYDLERLVPRGLLVDAKGGKPIKTTGEPPLVEPEDGDMHSSEFGAIVAYDPSRDVSVCLTRRGVWELDAAGAWTKHADIGFDDTPWHNDAGGTWDPVGKRVVFWLQGTDDSYRHVVLAWNGKLERVPTDGLPDLCFGMFDPCAMFVGHPVHGVVCHVGGGDGMYALAGKRWKRLPDAANPPPKMGGRFGNLRPRLAYEPSVGFVIGPGRYSDDDDGGRDMQQVFWVLRDGAAWQRFGAIARTSPISQSSNRHHAIIDGAWYCVSRSLQTFRWDAADGFRELVDDKAGDKLTGRERVDAVAATPEGLVAVGNRGGVWRFDATRWKPLAKPSAAYKDRSGVELVHDGVQLVAWGGDVKNRKSNDTLTFDGKRWTAAKQSSPTPKDWKAKDAYPDFPLVFDGALGRVVRFGFTEVATLDGAWAPVAPKGYKPGARVYDHTPVHDPSTGETLYVSFDDGAVWRFDLGGCVQVATIRKPGDVVADDEDKNANVLAWFREDVAFDPASRTLRAQLVDDHWGCYQLDLGPAFDAAKQLGARKLLGGAAKPKPPSTVTLYKHARGKVETWRGAAAQAAAKRKAGFVPAGELPVAALEALGTVPSSALVVVQKKPASHATSRLGGLPSGIDAKTWPKHGKQLMGFLFQLATGDRVPGFAGIAVFCTTDGTATEDESQNCAVLLTAKQLATAPLAKPPGDVSVLATKTITVAPALAELDEDAITALGDKDPELAAAFERYQANGNVQDSQLASKLGGAPVWLQGGEGGKADFIAQLDFDKLRIDRTWGLAGCIYLFRGKRGVHASWQYT